MSMADVFLILSLGCFILALIAAVVQGKSDVKLHEKIAEYFRNLFIQVAALSFSLGIAFTVHSMTSEEERKASFVKLLAKRQTQIAFAIRAFDYGLDDFCNIEGAQDQSSEPCSVHLQDFLAKYREKPPLQMNDVALLRNNISLSQDVGEFPDLLDPTSGKEESDFRSQIYHLVKTELYINTYLNRIADDISTWAQAPDRKKHSLRLIGHTKHLLIEMGVYANRLCTYKSYANNIDAIEAAFQKYGNDIGQLNYSYNSHVPYMLSAEKIIAALGKANHDLEIPCSHTVDEWFGPDLHGPPAPNDWGD